jgi:hypothetical protein
MTKMGKKELISATKSRYLKANKRDKSKMLDEFCNNTGYHRKYAIQILQAKCDYHKVSRDGRKPRKKKYDSQAMSAVIKVWELLKYPCGVRLQPNLISTLEPMIRFKEITVSEKVMSQLATISAKTIDRRLSREREIRKLDKHRGTTRHGSLLKSSIPIRITNWDTNEVGFMEMDTVSHNGGDPSGEFISTLDMVEICCGWSEQYAVMGKGEIGVVKAVNDIKHNLPFDLKGADSDSGSEFINWHMVRYCEKNNLYFTRSRPDRKNDNAYVEQKNYTHVRDWLGYGRFDAPEQLTAINDLYRNELRWYNNFFLPVMKIVSKEKINNSVCRKKYDAAKTPYQRLRESNQISDEQKQKLHALYLTLNPVQLKKVIDEKIKNIKKLQPLTK